MSITALLEHLGIDARRVAVELNLEVVKRGAFDSTVIHEGDEVEIVNFVGGGSRLPWTWWHQAIFWRAASLGRM